MRRSIGIAVMLGLAARVAAAQGALPAGAAVPAGTGNPTPMVRVAPPGALRLDGVLDDPAWQTADSIVDFTQRDPQQGAPVSERTVVRLLATQHGLWIGVWAYDRTPGAIRHTQLRRDVSLGTDDNFTVMLSPTSDKRTGFLFAVNANGARYDAEILSFESESAEWDGIWDARARVNAEGWFAEIVIPWQTLRYDGDADQWDANFRRYIRRNNESALWRASRRTEGIRFLERAGSIVGFRAAGDQLAGGLPGRAHVELRPYGTFTSNLPTRAFNDDGGTVVRQPSLSKGQGGFDAKLAPAPTLTLDLTANADFAQADVDRQVINLSRFSLFFPEQRPFFTEGAGIFDFGRRGETQLFYSRRIGLGAGGVPVPLHAGTRLTGRLGAQQLGLLAARTGGATPATDLIARVRRDLLGRGYVGAMATMHDPTNGRAAPAGGVDISLPFILGDEQNLVVNGGLAADGSDARGDPTYARLVVDYPNDNADIVARFDRIGEGFAPPLGFVQQRAVMRYTGKVELTPRPEIFGGFGARLDALGIRRLSFQPIGWRLVYGVAGNARRGLVNGELEVRPLGIEFDSGDEFEVNVQRQFDAPPEEFDIFDDAIVPAGRYAWTQGEIAFDGSAARPLQPAVRFEFGRPYGGRAQSLDASLVWRQAPHLVVTLESGLDRFALPATEPGAPEHRFTARTLRTRIDFAANPRVGTSFFAQWENESERLALNARLRWTPRPGSDLFVVWNSAWPTDLDGGFGRIPWGTPGNGALVVKYVHYFRY